MTNYTCGTPIASGTCHNRVSNQGDRCHWHDPEKKQKKQLATPGRKNWEEELDREIRELHRRITSNWFDSPVLTPRQAAVLSNVLNYWADSDLRSWLDGDDVFGSLDEVPPFFQFDKRVMMIVGESRPFTAKVRERCYALSEETQKG